MPTPSDLCADFPGSTDVIVPLAMDTNELTQLLNDVGAGHREALDRLLPLVYDGLGRMARAQLRRERDGHTLNTSALVHEAYLKLVDQQKVSWENRNHFFAVAATAMRRILVTYARARKRQKRGGGAAVIDLNDAPEIAAGEQSEEMLALDEALTRLASENERAARVVECRFFAGLSIEETAAALDIAPTTVKRDWTLARAWLQREMRE